MMIRARNICGQYWKMLLRFGLSSCRGKFCFAGRDHHFDTSSTYCDYTVFPTSRIAIPRRDNETIGFSYGGKILRCARSIISLICMHVIYSHGRNHLCEIPTFWLHTAHLKDSIANDIILRLKVINQSINAPSKIAYSLKTQVHKAFWVPLRRRGSRGNIQNRRRQSNILVYEKYELWEPTFADFSTADWHIYWKILCPSDI